LITDTRRPSVSTASGAAAWSTRSPVRVRAPRVSCAWPARASSSCVRSDVSPFPEILRAQRHHLAQLRHHPWQHVETTISAATHAIYQALRGGTWIPGQRQRLQQLAPGTWDQALASVLGGSPGRPDDDPGQAIVEIAIYPDVVWLAACSLRAHSASHRTASVPFR
jgi:hypothetical protein